MDKTTSMYRDADILIFNTGHWWTHDKTKLGENYYQEGNVVYPRLKVLEAYKRALTTWAKWVDKNIDPNQTYVIFRGGGPWNSRRQCHKETKPIFNTRQYQKKLRLDLEHSEPKKAYFALKNCSRKQRIRFSGYRLPL